MQNAKRILPNSITSKKKKKFPLTIYSIKDSILDAWQGSEYVFGIYTLLLTLFLAEAYS